MQGSLLLVKDGGTPESRKLIVGGKDSAGPALVGDPVANGATLVVSAFGGTYSIQTFSLSAGSNAKGKPFWSGDPVKGYKYKDPTSENGPVKVAKVKAAGGKFSLKAVVLGKTAALNVVPPNSGTSSCVEFSIGGGDTYDVAFLDGTITNSGATLFKVTKPETEAACVPTTTTTSTTTTTDPGVCTCDSLLTKSRPPGCPCTSNAQCCGNVCGGGGTTCTAAAPALGSEACCPVVMCPPANGTNLPDGCGCVGNANCSSGVCFNSICRTAP